MSEQKKSGEHRAEKQPNAGNSAVQGADKVPDSPKPESTAEYEGAKTRKPTGNPGTEVKTETSSSSGQ